MINLKPIVTDALLADAELTMMMEQEKRLYHVGSVQEAKLPCITYIEIENEPFAKGDEIELASRIVYQFDIWQKPGKSTSDIALAVDRIMTGLGGTRERAPDNDEEAPKECRVMVYSFIADNEGNIY